KLALERKNASILSHRLLALPICNSRWFAKPLNLLYLSAEACWMQGNFRFSQAAQMGHCRLSSTFLQWRIENKWGHDAIPHPSCHD
ncbi:hypothetical protein AVEN_41978-1, partial [Araneus ventricosus]